jgi:hypothetical protein
LLQSILDFVPPEDKEVLTALTGQALFYLPQDGLKHKVLALAEDEGSHGAAYPLKILQSEKQLVLAVTIRDPDGGMPMTQQKKVDGPVAQFMTSTQAEMDYELANRYLVLTVEESAEQTRKIHEAQRRAETLEGLIRTRDKQKIIQLHHDAQRLLKPLKVVIPYAQQLSFPHDRLRLRRDHKKYLGLIRAVAFLHQYQKPVKTVEQLQYIEADQEDLKWANELAAHALGRTVDDLSPPTRSFLLALDELVERHAKEQAIKRDNVKLSRRDIREQTKWSEVQVRRHLAKLVELEYVLQHRVSGTANRYQYQLAFDRHALDPNPFQPGPIVTDRHPSSSAPDET